MESVETWQPKEAEEVVALEKIDRVPGASADSCRIAGQRL